MFTSKLRRVSILGSVAIALLMGSTEAEAQVYVGGPPAVGNPENPAGYWRRAWRRSWRRQTRRAYYGSYYGAGAYSTYRPVYQTYRPAYTAYRPVTVASGCNTCYRPVAPCNTCTTTVQYAPQVSYRTQMVTVPVTAYQAVSVCDSCNGMQTVMRPYTTYVQRAHQVAYTTYRPVYSTSCASPCSTCGVMGCSTCATGGCASGNCGIGVSSAASGVEHAGPATNQPTYKETPSEGSANKPTEDGTSVMKKVPSEDATQPKDQLESYQKNSTLKPAGELKLFNPQEKEARRPATRKSVVRQAKWTTIEKVEPVQPRKRSGWVSAKR